MKEKISSPAHYAVRRDLCKSLPPIRSKTVIYAPFLLQVQYDGENHSAVLVFRFHKTFMQTNDSGSRGKPDAITSAFLRSGTVSAVKPLKPFSRIFVLTEKTCV